MTATIYLDVCCLNRPYDDQSQDRVRIEAAAVMLILQRVDRGEWQLVSSDAVMDEIDQTPDRDRRRRVQLLAAKAAVILTAGPEERDRAHELAGIGFAPYDAAHVAFAERGAADVLLTTDDRFIRRAQREAARLTVRVENPVVWLSQRLSP